MPSGTYTRSGKKRVAKAKATIEKRYIVLNADGESLDSYSPLFKTEKEVIEALETVAGDSGLDNPLNEIEDHEVYEVGKRVKFKVTQSEIHVTIGKE